MKKRTYSRNSITNNFFVKKNTPIYWGVHGAYITEEAALLFPSGEIGASETEQQFVPLLLCYEGFALVGERSVLKHPFQRRVIYESDSKVNLLFIATQKRVLLL